MLKSVDFYFFSPTGGTKKSGWALASAISENVNICDLGAKSLNAPCSDVIVVAAPVFAGRIPALVAEKLAKLEGSGRKAITAVVYGVRAYDDALRELNDVMTSSGFEIVGSAALVAQHSMVPEVGAGRPDENDISEIREFASCILTALDKGRTGSIVVPGNRPYKDGMKVTATPLSLDACVGCGHCADICPTEAISVTGNGIATDIGRCILCLACTMNCPTGARILPPPMRSGLAERLSALKDVRMENEFYIV